MIDKMSYRKGLDERLAMSLEGRVGLSTGWEKLDRTIRGLHKGKLYVVGGRPGAGKTSFGTSLTAGILGSNENVQVIYFSTELDEHEISDQVVECAAGGTAIMPNDRVCHSYEKDRILEASGVVSECISNFSLRIIYEKRLTISRIVQESTDLVFHGREPVVIIDQASRIERDDAGGRRGYAQATETMLNQLEALTSTLDLPVVLLTQANRNAQGKPPLNGRLQALRGLRGIRSLRHPAPQGRRYAVRGCSCQE